MRRAINNIFTLLIIFTLPFILANPGEVLSKEPRTSGKISDKVVWHSFDQGLRKAKSENKHILVDFYTDWCGWCKKMDRDTYSNEEVKKILNQGFVAVKLNAESKRALDINGAIKKESQIAQEYRVTGYPTTVFLKANGDRVILKANGLELDKIPGYLPPENFAYIISYVQDKAYEKKIDLNDYANQKDNSNKGGQSKKQAKP